MTVRNIIIDKDRDTTSGSLIVCSKSMVGWLFLVLRPFETVFQSISGRLPKRGRKRRETIDECKNVQTTPTRTYSSTVGPCPTEIQIVGRPGTGSLPSTIAPPDHPCKSMEGSVISNGNIICVFQMCFLETKSSRLISLRSNNVSS